MNIDTVGGARGLTGIPTKTTFTVAFIFMIASIVIIKNIINSSQGRAMLSIRENEIAAESMGINALKYKMMAFVIAAFFAGLAGGLYAHYSGYIKPDLFDFNKSIDYLTFVVFAVWDLCLDQLFSYNADFLTRAFEKYGRFQNGYISISFNTTYDIQT
ncbi:branched-chain amino acid ABC transporter permease [Clostridium beijerinckii]|uniref:branched-chain amino acid ABC transporter permease n=1 Tax=Clostridium beijerinckii TaxID=1520 RepID=UPI00237B4D8C|nr:branched-chain amino acid ABC transporter permease [Clostridium beijerinckii]NRW77839.1 ABC-type branched-subunit amino acid transport system permease subunit [Clostridium beijerinckii]